MNEDSMFSLQKGDTEGFISVAIHEQGGTMPLQCFQRSFLGSRARAQSCQHLRCIFCIICLKK